MLPRHFIVLECERHDYNGKQKTFKVYYSSSGVHSYPIGCIDYRNNLQLRVDKRRKK